VDRRGELDLVVVRPRDDPPDRGLGRGLGDVVGAQVVDAPGLDPRMKSRIQRFYDGSEYGLPEILDEKATDRFDRTVCRKIGMKIIRQAPFLAAHLVSLLDSVDTDG
jgi:hypothetical protein